MRTDKPAIIGSGPAGMACAYTLAKSGISPLILEKEPVAGGLCRTIDFKGYLFDIGGHRFLSKSPEINLFWPEIMGDRLLRVKRLSRIYYRKRYFNYPLSFFNTLFNLGPVDSFLCLGSYLKHVYTKPSAQDTFEGWITSKFGRLLYEIFFKSYTEKIWGIPCKEISSDWASQRIRGLSLGAAIIKALFGLEAGAPKTLCTEFLYPSQGPGEFYTALKALTEKNGADFLFGKKVLRIRHSGYRIVSCMVEDRATGIQQELPVAYLFSSIPLSIFIRALDPPAPQKVLQAAGFLSFRSFLVVNVILNRPDIFKDQWVYVHSPQVKLARIQNYKNWSAGMVSDMRKTSLGLEYFCFEGDALWLMSDTQLIEFALNELESIGISAHAYFLDAFVTRHADAYPVYRLGYQEKRKLIFDYVKQFTNFQTLGRAGLFCYGNSDHALLTGIYAAKNYLRQGDFDLSSVNADKEYLEA